MSTITEPFKQAELALAAYSNLSPGILGIKGVEINGVRHDFAHAATLRRERNASGV
jgi:hypothetical protein